MSLISSTHRKLSPCFHNAFISQILNGALEILAPCHGSVATSTSTLAWLQQDRWAPQGRVVFKRSNKYSKNEKTSIRQKHGAGLQCFLSSEHLSRTSSYLKLPTSSSRQNKCSTCKWVVSRIIFLPKLFLESTPPSPYLWNQITYRIRRSDPGISGESGVVKNRFIHR